jgi:hypothetical protein
VETLSIWFNHRPDRSPEPTPRGLSGAFHRLRRAITGRGFVFGAAFFIYG